MTWTRLGDDYADRPAMWDLTDAAWRLHTSAMVASVRLDLDGRLPASRVPSLVPAFAQATVDELVMARLWAPLRDGIYRILDDKLNDQLGSEEVVRQRASNRERQKRWRDKVRANRDAAERAEPSGALLTRDVTPLHNAPAETHPGPSRPEGRMKNVENGSNARGLRPPGTPGDCPHCGKALGNDPGPYHPACGQALLDLRQRRPLAPVQ